MKHLLLVPLLAAVLAGCAKKEDVAETKSDPQSGNVTGQNIVTLTPANLEHMKLNTEIVSQGNLGMVLKAAGRVSADLIKTAKVTPTLEGRLTKLNFDLNARVKTGDVLALIESPELLGKQLELKAPIDGVIIERAATVGELVEKGREICTISDPTELWVIAEIKERDIAAVKAGQDATFTVLAYPGEKFTGKITLIGNQVEAASRTLEARITVNNSDGRLKPGMFADVEIITTVLENVLLISDSALQTDGEDQVVFVALGDNKFEKCIVTLGEEQQDRVQVRAGLKEGEKVVTNGSFILKSEMLKGELGEE